jgi:hypothetical protein
MISTNTVKPKLNDRPQTKRVILSSAVKVGGAFNFNGGRYAGVKPKPKHTQGVIFTNQLQDIAAAKTRAARIEEAKRAQALKAALPKKVTSKGRAKKGK